MGKNRFVSNDKKRIELTDNDWVDIRDELSFSDFNNIYSEIETEDDVVKIAMPMLKAALLDWSFKNGKDKKLDCTPENIERLDAETATFLIRKVIKHYMPEKKSSRSSKQTSKDTPGKGQGKK